jgi:plastocyanin
MAKEHKHPMSADIKKEKVAAVAPKAKSPGKSKPAPKKATNNKRPAKMPAAWGGEANKSLVISTLPGMKYDQSRMTVKAGSKVKLTFYNNDDMPHNIVFTTPGGADAVGKAAMNLGLKGQAMDYVPSMSQVLFHSKLLGPGRFRNAVLHSAEKTGCVYVRLYFSGTLSDDAGGADGTVSN